MKRGRDKTQAIRQEPGSAQEKGPRGPGEAYCEEKLPERRAMIAAARRRIGAVLASGAAQAHSPASTARRSAASSEPRPPLAAAAAAARRSARQRAGRGLAAAAAAARWRSCVLRALRRAANGWLRRAGAAAVRAATRASAVVTPRRAIGGVDPRLRRLPARLPVRRLPRRSRSASPATPGLPDVGARRRPSTRGPPATPTPTCWSRSRCSPRSLGGRWRCAASAAARAGRRRPRAAQRSP